MVSIPLPVSFTFVICTVHPIQTEIIKRFRNLPRINDSVTIRVPTIMIIIALTCVQGSRFIIMAIVPPSKTPVSRSNTTLHTYIFISLKADFQPSRSTDTSK